MRVVENHLDVTKGTSGYLDTDGVPPAENPQNVNFKIAKSYICLTKQHLNMENMGV